MKNPFKRKTLYLVTIKYNYYTGERFQTLQILIYGKPTISKIIDQIIINHFENINKINFSILFLYKL
jgi:hypothetical protein